MQITVAYPGAPGDVPVIRAPIRLSASDKVVATRAPQLGEHSDAILAEIEDAPTVSNERLRTPYSWMYNLDFPPEHPRRAWFRWSSQIITADAFAEDGPGCALFGCRELVEFVRRLLGYASLYPSVCPTLSVMASVLDEGDENGWHFDTNDGVVSILLQAADDGGHFDQGEAALVPVLQTRYRVPLNQVAKRISRAASPGGVQRNVTSTGRAT